MPFLEFDDANFESTFQMVSLCQCVCCSIRFNHERNQEYEFQETYSYSVASLSPAHFMRAY